MLNISTNLHVHPETPITVTHQSETGAHVVKFGDYASAYASVFFDSADEVRRLRDALDAHLVGRLGGETS